MKIQLASSMYSPPAVKNALFEFSNDFIFKIEDDGNQINIEIQSKGMNEFPIQDFYSILLDFQIRFDTEKEFKVIREIIVAQAFEPCDNLKDVISHLNP